MLRNSETERLAGQISDGTPVDWQALGVAEHQRSALELLDKIAQSFRQPTSPQLELQTWGQLRLRGLLGEGSYGSVFRAFDPLLMREVALKLSRPDDPHARRWVQEARRLSRVRHHNVVTIHGAEVHDGRAGIWFELVEGIALDEWVAQHGAWGAEETIAAGQTLCGALAAIHASGLLHGDIKPANIMREAGGRLVLVDFGSAGELSDGSLRSGSPGYLPPELLAGGAPAPATDLYALGMTLCYLLIGRLPDPHANLMDMRPDLPPSLIHFLSRSLAEDPGQRPATAGQFARELDRCSGRPPASQPTRPVLAGLAVVFALATAVWALWPSQPAVPVLMHQLELVTRSDAGEAIAPTEPLSLGSPLSLRFASKVPLFVYVVNQDDGGHRYVLYPLTDPPVAVPAGSVNLLPGVVNGHWVDWQVSSSSSREQFAVFAASQRLLELEQLLKSWANVGDSAAPNDYRGVGALVARSHRFEGELSDLVQRYDPLPNVEARMLSLPAQQ